MEMQHHQKLLKMLDYKLVCSEVAELAKKAGAFIRNEKTKFSFDWKRHGRNAHR